MAASLETRVALGDVTARYAQAVDRHDRDALTALFTVDAVLVQPPALLRRNQDAELHGNAEIAAGVLTAVAHLRATRHLIGQQVIDTSDGDTASAETYCTAHHIYARGDDVRDNTIAIRYRDTFRRDEDGWRIARRELQVDFTDDRPVTQPG